MLTDHWKKDAIWSHFGLWEVVMSIIIIIIFGVIESIKHETED